MDDEGSEERYNSRNQEQRTTPDWGKEALKGEHLWVPTSVSGDFCYVGDANCSRRGSRLKCSSCKVIVHQKCLNQLIEKQHFKCRSTFENKPLGQSRRKLSVAHHWVRRYSEKSKCEHCAKNFQCKIFNSKEMVAISCSWCKSAFHNRDVCFDTERIPPDCNLGVHRSIIVPPNWIHKTSTTESETKEMETESKNKSRHDFMVRAIPGGDSKPIIVFINPKSGGNQGLRLLQKFQWLLNPRQVFDLTQGGPKMGLELFEKVHNLRVLACGGDGTVGWVLSVIDQIKMTPAPAVGVLPLGTGNDLARALGWGGGYTDEPVGEILSGMMDSQPVLLDRWKVEVEKNNDVEDDQNGKSNLPLNVINNYFSMGVDAHIALEFHEAREANPAKFNSRLKNKMFYGQLGGKDLLRRKWKCLTNFITLECDGTDFTPKLRELKVHAIVFLNIASYGGGTRPWNPSMGNAPPSTEDGLIEVVGLTTYQLPLLQAGGHGTCITQCKTARIVTSKTIPMQVDGEACKVAPSILTITLLNKAIMLAHKKSGIQKASKTTPDTLEINLHCVSMSNYEKLSTQPELLMKSATNLQKFEIDYHSDLLTLRDSINQFVSNSKDEFLSNDWFFLDGGVTGNVLKVDREEERLLYVSDITYNSNLYIVEYINETRPLTPRSDAGSDVVIKPEVIKIKSNNKVVPTHANPATPISKPHTEKRSPLVIPIERKSLQKILFDLTDDTYSNYYRGKKNSYAGVMTAVHKRDRKAIEELKRKGNLVGVRSPEGCKLLHTVAVDGDTDSVSFLIKYVFTDFHKVEHLF